MRKARRLNRRGKVLLITLFALAAACVLGFVAAPKVVAIKIDGEVVSIETRAMTLKGALEDAGVVVGEADSCTLVNTNKFEDGAQIEIVRAMPIRVWKSDSTNEYFIGRRTVREVLESLEIDYKNYTVTPGLDTRPQPGMLIHVLPFNSKLSVKTVPVPFDTEYRKDERIPEGKEELLVEGKPGSKEVFSAISELHGKKAERILDEKLLEKPTSKVVLLGTGRNMLETSRGYVRYKHIKTMEATAYTLAEGSGTGLTSTGIVPTHGVIAVDPDVIAYGTRVYIPEYGFATAADCGGAIVGDRIDLYMEDIRDALHFGRREVSMYILEE